MKKKNKKQLKSMTVSLVVCFVALLGVVGNAVFRHEKNTPGENRDNRTKEEAQQEEELPTEPTAGSDVANTQEKEEEEIKDESENEAATPTQNSAESLQFSADVPMAWPVEGVILLNYSMDQTVYFATLDQYKYNPALIISGEVGQEVLAARTGTVTAVEVDAQTGTTVTVDMGSGYQAKYGQLKEVALHEGDFVQTGEIIGYLSEPTKYYSVEGCNLYFQMLKDGEPVNPLEYLDI